MLKITCFVKKESMYVNKINFKTIIILLDWWVYIVLTVIRICTYFSWQCCMHYSSLLPLLQILRAGTFKNGCIWLYFISFVHCSWTTQWINPNCHADSGSEEQGKAGGHEPPLFPLPCHILAFLSYGSHEPPLFPLLCHHIWLFRAKLLI